MVRPILAALWLLLLPQDKPKDEIFVMGEEAFKKAQEKFDKREWFDAIEQAEKARTAFLALEDLYDAQGRTDERKQASDYVKRCNQLIKLSNDARISEKKGAAPPPEPKPDPKSDPPPDPKPQERPPDPPKPADPEAGLPSAPVTDFCKLLNGDIDSTKPELMAPILAGLKSLLAKPGPWQNWSKVAWTIASRVQRGDWSVAVEDRPAFKGYSDKVLVAPVKFDHRKATLYLAEQAEKTAATLPRWRLFRMLALAHAADALAIPDSPLLLELASMTTALDLVREGDADGWPTREGNFIHAVRTTLALKDAKPLSVWKDIPSVKDPIRICYKALSLFEHIASAPPEEARALISECHTACAAASSAEPSSSRLMGALKALMDSKKPCKWCEGTHQRRCANGCNEKGEKLLTCSRCSGLGYMLTRGRQIECPQTPPKGKEWEKGHTCMWPCPKCQGKSTVECKDCKEPWSGKSLMEGIKSDPCDICAGSGWLLASMKLACYECFASGKKYTGLKK